MTDMLEKAVVQARQLSEEQQDAMMDYIRRQAMAAGVAATAQEGQ